jgi:curli biogenesis system outer membrane secretion channel CsgG
VHPTTRTVTIWILRLMAALALTTPWAAAEAQPAAAEKPRLAVREIQVQPGVLEAARRQGQADALNQIVQAADGQLIQAVLDTRRFDIVARSDLSTVLREQNLADSGLLDPADPQTARAFALAGARYVATVSVDNFQDAVARADFSGGLGRTTMERRTVQLLASLRLYDTSTGVLLDSTTIRLEESDVRETLPGATEEGRLTNALLGAVAESFARQAANAVMDRLAPAKVIAYTAGQITLNRAEGTGIAPGQFWRVFHPGRELIDPDTGERLGTEEIPVGWARILEVNPRFSTAQALEDTGIDIGAVMRPAWDGLPPGVNPDTRVFGSASNTARPGAPAAQPSAQPFAPQSWNEPAPTQPAAAATGSARVAIFVRITDSDIPDRHTDTIETWVTSGLAGQGVEVISRAVVLNAVSELSSAGANRGGNDSVAAEAVRLLSDQASASALARTLGADAILIATAADLSESRRRFNDPTLGVDSDITETTLSMAWSLISGDTGGAVAAGSATSADRQRQSGQNQSSPTDLGTLIRDAGTRIGRQARAEVLASRLAPAAGSEVAVDLRVSIEQISLPNIRKVDGQWVITGERLAIVPAEAGVLIDGFLAGSAPGTIRMTPGPHRMRLEGPGFQPVDRFIVAREGMVLTVPLQLRQEALDQWRQHAQLLNFLKDGDTLRENQEAIARGVAQFLAASRLTIDTSSLESLDLSPDAASFWLELLRP